MNAILIAILVLAIFTVVAAIVPGKYHIGAGHAVLILAVLVLAWQGVAV